MPLISQNNAVALSTLTLIFILTTPILSDVITDLTNPRSALCQEPSDVMEMYRDHRRYVIDHSSDFYTEATDEHFLLQQNVSVIALHKTSCVGIGGRGLTCSCPQKEEVNFDPNRIPRVLIQSSCCRRNTQRRRNWRLGCRNVTHHLSVLRRVACNHGTYRYERVWEEISVGCSCFSLPR